MKNENTGEMKQYNIFGGVDGTAAPERDSRKRRHDDYEGFVEKFRPKRTTDDCYTPPEVYEAVLEWLGEQADLSGLEIIRPFYPGGDYERFPYPERCAVVDNPPFSIITKIVRHYERRGVSYFLFAPTLTLLSIPTTTVVACCARIVYGNGAKVSTSFVTNMLGRDDCVITAPSLAIRIERAQIPAAPQKCQKPMYSTPRHVLAIKDLLAYCRRRIPYTLKRSECVKVRNLDGYKAIGKNLFSHGFILSDRAARDRAEADRAEADRAVQAKAVEIPIALSEREMEIVRALSGGERQA